MGILIGTNASGKSNVLDAFAFLRAVGEGKNLLDAIQTVRGGEDWIIRIGEDSFCIEIEIEIDGSSYLLDLRVIKRNHVQVGDAEDKGIDEHEDETCKLKEI